MLPLNTYMLPLCVRVIVSIVASSQRFGALLVSGGGPIFSSSGGGPKEIFLEYCFLKQLCYGTGFYQVIYTYTSIYTFQRYNTT